MLIKTFLLLFLIGGIIAGDPLQISKAYLASDETQAGSLSGSVMGGTQIVIVATGLTGISTDYLIMVSNYQCIIEADGVQTNRISCKTSPTGGSSDEKNLPIQVYFEGSQYEVPQRYNYLAGSTPQIDYVFPLAAPSQTVLYYYGKHRIADVGDGLRDWGDIKAIQVGNEICNLENVQQIFNQQASNSAQFLKCKQAKVQEAGRYNVKTHVNAGYSRMSDSWRNPTNFENDNYEHVVVPTVESVTPKVGLMAGHQITITGTGFSSLNDRNQVTVDGLDCEITDATQNMIKCNRAAKTDPAATSELQVVSGSAINGWIGGAGFEYKKYEIRDADVEAGRVADPTTYSAWKTALESDPSPYNLLQEGYKHQLWVPNYDQTPYAYVMKGYFYAPVTGDYIFSGYGDDNFALYMSDTHNTSTVNPTPEIYSNSAMSEQDNLFIQNRTDARGSPRTLQGGSYYYMEVYFCNTGGAGYLKIRVEVPNSDNSLKWQRYEVNQIKHTFTHDPEVIQFTLSNVDPSVGDQFNIRWQKQSGTLEDISQVASLTLTESASSFATKIGRIDIFKYAISGISAEAFDVDGNPVATSSLDARTFKWKINCWNPRTNEHITAQQASRLSVVAVTTNSGISMDVDSTHPHGPLITGTFTISDGSSYLQHAGSPNIPFYISQNDLAKVFKNRFGSNSDIKVKRLGDWGYGFTWIISYNGVNLDIPDLIIDGTNLAGGLAGTQPQVSFYEDQKYSTNLVFNPVGNQFLFTPAPSLNVLVQTNGILAECTGDCTYTIQTNTPQVTANTLTGATVSVTMTDPQSWAYPTTDLAVTVDGQVCTITSGTFQAFSCTLPTNGGDGSPILTAGNWFVKVLVKNMGEVPIASAAAAMPYSLALNASNPVSGGVNGGYSATLTGNGFPSNPDLVSITTCGGAPVEITSISNTQISIVVPKCGTAAADTFSVTYGQTLTTPFTYTASTVSGSITSISPDSASPVLKEIMTITGSGFGTDENAVKVRLADATNKKFYQMKILSITDTQIECGIPGGVVGSYEVEVNIIGQGDIEATPDTANDFTYELEVQSISPTSGSYYGGTLVTITGKNFSPNDAENQIYVGEGLSWFCNIETVSATSITCRMPQFNEQDWSLTPPLTQNVYLSSKLIQDATGSLTFTYDDQSTSPALSAVSRTSIPSGSTTLTLTGTNFDIVAAADVRVVFENKFTKEKIIITPSSVTATQIILASPKGPAGPYLLRARFDPEGETNSLDFQMRAYFQQSSYEGSIMGDNMLLTGNGLPTQWPSNLFSLVVKKDGINISPQIVQTTHTALKIKVGAGQGINYQIILTDPTGKQSLATFTQTSSATPTLNLDTSSTITAGTETTVTLTQTNLLTENPTKVYVHNVLDQQEMVQVDMANVVLSSPTIQFPYTFRTGSYAIKLWYENYGWAQVSSTVSVSAAADFTASSTTSSYMGGQLTVTGAFISQNARLNVGIFSGKVISSTDTDAVFEIPALVTSEVLAQYPELNVPKKIQQYTVISDGGALPERAFDGLSATIYSSSSADCFIGLDLGAGRLMNVRRIRYFPTTQWLIASTHLTGVVFEASTDGSSYDQIAVIDETVHTGWNSIVIDVASNYRFVRLSDVGGSSMCKIAEIEVFGVQMSDITVADVNSFTTSAIVTDGLNSYTLTDVIQYRVDKTPTVTSLNRVTGAIFGGDNLVMTGTNLNLGTAEVLIDEIPCVVNAGATTATNLECVTGARAGLPDEMTFDVIINGNKALIKDKFEYVMPWSDKRTWGVDMPPIEGDLVVVPENMALYVDQSTPVLQGIVVNGGKLIFADEGGSIQVHTGFITLNGGQFRAGTEQHPYQSNLEFILYGQISGRQQPVVGNKGIGCMQCKLSMYGKVRSKTWTTISATIDPDDTTFTVSQAVDWQVGEEVVIASTDFDHNHAERRTITAKSGNTFTVSEAFEYEHLSVTETYSTNNLVMEAEVGLLTRNIKMHGDDSSDTLDQEYGSHLMIAGSSQKGAQGHVAYTQFYHCGQPRIMGRYCIHFHMNGDVSDSFVLGNAVHDSFARILTVHAVKYLHASYNVGYRVKGHNFFIEDGVETHNTLEYNLVISSLQSWNMMQTDISVASFWVTNPTNNVRYNRAAGGDFYGFWYEIKEHPDGPSATTDICPIGNPSGESHDNIAHSYKRFGLRIFKLYSRENPCSPIRDDTLEDPWSTNPSIQSRFYNYILYKNGEDGLLAEETGNCLFENMVIADSGRAGMQFYRTNLTKEAVEARNITIIGSSANNAEPAGVDGSFGVIMPRTSNWKMSDINFHNFPSGTTVMQTCSMCDNALLFTNNVNEYIINDITFNNVTGNYLHMNGAHKNDIIYDLDSSLTSVFDGRSRTSGALVYGGFKHLAADTACKAATTPSKWNNALICDQTAKVKGVLFTNFLPHSRFVHLGMKTQLLSDSSQWVAEDSTSYSQIYSQFGNMEPNGLKPFSYSFPFIGGRTYNIWFLTGLDFTHMALDVSQLMDDSDPAIIFKFNYTENRELYEINHLVNRAKEGPYILTSNNPMLDPSTCTLGQYTHDNDEKYLTLCATSRGKVRDFQYLDVNGIFCRYHCPAPAGQFQRQNFTRLWSNQTQWPEGRLPTDGENVTIPGPWTLVIDIPPPEMDFWEINGRVVLRYNSSNHHIHIKAKAIWIKAGEFETEIDNILGYYPGKLTFELLGNRGEQQWIFSPSLSGEKIMVNTGILKLYGRTPATTWTKLTDIVHVEDTTMNVQSADGWAVGDQLAIGPSFSDHTEHQIVTITAITGTEITFEPALQYNHYGAASVTISNSFGDLDTRAAVGHITRDIRFIAGDDSGWGYRLAVFGYSDTYYDTGLQQNVTIMRTGMVQLEGVQFYQGGQYDTENSPLQFQNAIGDEPSYVKGSSFHDCKSFCMNIQNSIDLTIQNNVFYKGRLFHVRVLSTDPFRFENNLMIAATTRPTFSGSELVSCFGYWEPLHERDVLIRNNLCQGSSMHGFALPKLPCANIDSPPYSENTVGSASAAFIFSQISGGHVCLGVTNVKAYASGIAQISSFAGPDKMIYQNYMVADCGRGASLRFGKEGDDKTAQFKNAFVTAISRPSCSECYGQDAIDCTKNQGIRMLANTVNSQSFPSKFGPGFDVICKSETFDSKAFLTDITFENFNQEYSDLPQCSGNVIFKPHPVASDLTGTHHLSNVRCNNCSVDAYASFTPPNPRDLGWDGGCGKILCTGMNNYMIHDWTGDLLGFHGILLANNSWIGDNEENCTFNEAMNGHVCERNDFGVLEYQSIAPDKQTRIMWPVYLSYDGGLWNSSTNAYREWQWQGNEPLNKRLARFISVVTLNKDYDMQFESEPPLDMQLQFQRRKLETGQDDVYIIVRLTYFRPNSIRIMHGTNTIKPIVLKDGGTQAPLDTTLCGSNKYFYFNSTIHFVVTGQMGCMVRVTSTTSLQLTARFSMDVNDFFTAGGQTKFVDRLCALLGIVDTSRVKIVGVYAGSTVVNAVIEPPPTPEDDAAQADYEADAQQMQGIQQALNGLEDSGSLATGFSGDGLTGFEDLDTSLYTHRSSSQQEEEEEKKITNVALIVGVILGSGILISMVVVGCMYLLRKRAKIGEIPMGETMQKPSNSLQYVDTNSIVGFEKSKM